jgi:hypothetical protein
MNQAPNLMGSVDEIVHASGPALVAVTLVGLAVVIGSIIFERMGHGQRVEVIHPG